MQYDFFIKVYDLVKSVPYGRVTTYGAIARCIGSGGAARTVGWALNASHHTQWDVPAHRVVNRRGMLSGKCHFNPPDLMNSLLESEGIKIKDDYVVDFDDLFWDPSHRGSH